MDHPVVAARRKVAARLEAEIIGHALPNPYAPQPKGRVERAVSQYVRGSLTRKELRARLEAIKAEASA